MAKAESTEGSSLPGLNIEFMRSLVKQYSELGQWTSALFWADAAMAASSAMGGDACSGDDVWLLAGTMLARGELHRAAHAVTSRGLHRRHLLCLGVAMRALVSAREPAAALALLDECDPMLLEPRNQADQTHNRALAGVGVWQARALWALERREAAAAALAAALRADVACVEALDMLLEQHALTPAQESELLESLPISSQLGGAEGALVRAAYSERLKRHAPPAPPDELCPSLEACRGRTAEAACGRARRLAAACRWGAALSALDGLDPWCCPEVRVACLVELRRASQLFALAHTLVDAYPHSWQAWYAVGCYYYLIGKSEFARRYLSKAKSVEPGAGCVWLAYGHSFASDSEHDQAMAAYFKASQLMPGCHVPALYVGVECSLLNNVTMCERFLARAASLYQNQNTSEVVEECDENKSSWERLAGVVQEPHVAHEAGCAALAAAQPGAARALWLRALAAAGAGDAGQVSARWAPTLDALGHACRQLGQPAEALQWHERALALRPGRASTYAAMGLCLALLGRETEAADALHSALAKDPDDVVSLALLDAIVDRLDSALTEEEIPQFPFPSVQLSPPRAASPAAGPDHTNTSDMSMSFD
ncbi:cell division cycle protein 16 homolog [Pectinophora gossypiella]|uniref:cell division cycle protein 16 homolog n=1 Tax=Pectinophora gossypiella TaxID=13191 RepID=UPI00214E6C15|nr:cell division cycle protein 16 homolog [Pectinophora gossypiella]